MFLDIKLIAAALGVWGLMVAIFTVASYPYAKWADRIAFCFAFTLLTPLIPLIVPFVLPKLANQYWIDHVKPSKNRMSDT